MRASRRSMKPNLRRREAKTAATGKKPGGKPPQPPAEGPQHKDQINLTDEDSRIMPVAGGGFEQCYNAQAAVAAGSLLVVAVDVVQAPNDKQQLEPMLDKVANLPDALGKVEELLADNGYFSAGNVNACAAAGIEPVFGIIKSVLGFRQFLLRGLDNVRGEWNLVTMAWNMKRMFVLAGAI